MKLTILRPKSRDERIKDLIRQGRRAAARMAVLPSQTGYLTIP